MVEIFVCSIGFLSIAASAADFKDIPYSDVEGQQLLLDAHIPDGVGPFPTAILVHGGGWVAGDKQQYITYIFQPLSEAGFAWFSINYRLAPQYKFPADADDVEAAIRFVKVNAVKYKVDPRRIALIGESAGGHLVSYVGARNRAEIPRGRGGIHVWDSRFHLRLRANGNPCRQRVLQLFGISEIDADAAPDSGESFAGFCMSSAICRHSCSCTDRKMKMSLTRNPSKCAAR